jgi:hypothetical protein
VCGYENFMEVGFDSGLEEGERARASQRMVGLRLKVKISKQSSRGRWRRGFAVMVVEVVCC